jgi:FG-GAP-like repeat
MKNKLFTTLIFTFTFMLFAVIANAGTFFTVNMSGANVTPPTTSTATAFLAFELIDSGSNGGLAKGKLLGTGIPTTGVDVRVQCPSGTYFVFIDTNSIFNLAFGTTTAEIASIREMKNGACFFSLGMPIDIGGFGKVTSPYQAFLNQDQFIGTQAFIDPIRTGKASLLLNNNQTKALLIISYTNMIPVQNIRIFSGKPGENGILTNTIPNTDYDNILPFSYSFVDITAFNLAKLKSGQLYVEVTQTTLGIRGQFHRQRSVAVDYDGDGKTDQVVARKNTASNIVNWYARRSSDGGLSVLNTANAAHADNFWLTPGDFDGDGKDDVAYWLNGTFYILQSGNSILRTENFGVAGDNPSIIDDFDGDGKTDLAVYRAGVGTGSQSFFYYKPSANNPTGNITFVPFGLTGDYPSSGDYDGDAKADFAVQRPTPSGQSQFWILKSSGGNLVYTFGFNSDLATPGDYDGDGKTDVCITRQGAASKEWFVLRSVNLSYYAFPFGIPTARPTQGDYDGDGKTDPGVAQAIGTQNYFWTIRSSDGVASPIQWGLNTDIVVNTFNVH